MPIAETSYFFSPVTAFLPIITVVIIVLFISFVIYKVKMNNRK
jgi:hypothetical protein